MSMVINIKFKSHDILLLEYLGAQCPGCPVCADNGIQN